MSELDRKSIEKLKRIRERKAEAVPGPPATPAPSWVRCDERLPDKDDSDKSRLVTIEKEGRRYVVTATYGPHPRWHYDDYFGHEIEVPVIAWQEMPEPYEGNKS